jgi:hypothetical protein
VRHYDRKALERLAYVQISTYLTGRVDAALLTTTGGPRPRPEAANRTLRRLAESFLGAEHDFD